MRNKINIPIKPIVYEYYNYRIFLKDLFDFYKNEPASVFSNRYIVKKAGLSSPSALRNVINNRRHLSLTSAEKFADAFQLTADERRYFLALVAFALAGSTREKERCLEDVMAMRHSHSSPRQLGSQHEEYFSQWWHSVIREAIMLPDAKKSSLWVSRILCSPVSPAEVKKSLALMKRIGLIKKAGGGWKQAEATLSTDSLVLSVKALHYHRAMIGIALKLLGECPPAEREYSGTTVRIAKNDLPKAIAMIRDFRKKMLCFAEASENADQIYQLNCQFFPLVSPVRQRRTK